MNNRYMKLVSRQHEALKKAAKRKADAEASKYKGPVKLSAKEERKYKQWWNTDPDVIAWKKDLAGPDFDYRKISDDPKQGFYDYRKAWKAGEKPKYSSVDGTYHWSSVGKMPGHPTAWKEEYMQRAKQDPDVVERFRDTFRAAARRRR